MRLRDFVVKTQTLYGFSSKETNINVLYTLVKVIPNYGGILILYGPILIKTTIKF